MIELQPSRNQSIENNLRTVLNKYSRYWPLFAICLIVSILVTFLYLRYFAVDQYEVTGKIQIKNSESGKSVPAIDNLNSLGLIKNSHNIDDEIGILSSYGLMEEVLTEHEFNVMFYKEGRIRDVELYGEQVPVRIQVDETFEDLAFEEPIYINLVNEVYFELNTSVNDEDFSSKHKYGELISLPYGIFTITKNENFDLSTFDKDNPLYFKVGNKEVYVNKFLEQLSVIPESESGSLLNLSFVSTHKKKGEDLLTKLIETYIERTIAFENELAETTIQMIDERLKHLSGNIEKVEDSVVDFKTRNVVTDVSSNADTYIEQANDYKKRMVDYDTQISVLENIEQTLLEGNTESTIGGVFSIDDEALSNLIDRYNENLMDKQRLSQSAGITNPVFTRIDATLSKLRESILQNVRSLKNGYIIARGNLLSNAGRFDARIAKIPAMEKQLLEISREKSTMEGLYLYLLQKREEEILSMAAPVSSTRIISLPKAGIFPVSPNRKLIYLFGLLLGFFIPTSITYLKESLNNKVSRVEDVSDRISAPYLGEIYKTKGKEVLVIGEDNTSPNSELFRLLHFNIDYLKKSERNQTLLVTSTIKGEGKTYIASNLGASLAYSGEKVVILAFDLREPKLMQNFNLPDSPGIADYVVKEGVKANQIIQRHPEISNLYLIGSGIARIHISRLMLSDRIKLLMNELKEDFDRIIIDTAPIGIVSDAFALNPYIDSTIYVVRKGVTKIQYLKHLNSIYENGKLKNTMVLLNDIKQPSDQFGYGYGIS